MYQKVLTYSLVLVYCSNQRIKIIFCEIIFDEGFLMGGLGIFEDDGAVFQRKCRQMGLPYTIQRRTVYDILTSTTSHPTADSVYDEARRILPNISRTSVFRILDTFVEYGLAQKIETPAAVMHYDGNVERHAHTICAQCGGIGDWFDAPNVEISLPTKTEDGFAVRDYSLTLSGVCARCAGKGDA